VLFGVTSLILSGVPYTACRLIFGVGRCTVYEVFHRTVRTLGSVLTLAGIPSDERKPQELAIGFKNSRSPANPLSGCIGALDGIAIKIKKPEAELNPSQLYCRKHFYALPLQKVVDSDCRFIYCSLKCVGSTHDGLSFSVSGLANYLRSGGLKRGLWIATDDAYEYIESIITPIPKRRAPMGTREDAFNFYHSLHRMHVEQAFGGTCGEMGILWKPLQFDLYNSAGILDVVLKVHNYCIEDIERCMNTGRTADERQSHCNNFGRWMGRTTARFSSNAGRRRDLE